MGLPDTSWYGTPLTDSVQPLTWGLVEVLQFAEVLLNKDDVDAKADALIDFIRERVVGRDFDEPGFSRVHRVASFADLDAWFRDVLRKLEESNGDTWRTHHAATVRKVRNRLSNLSTRCAGLVTDDGRVATHWRGLTAEGGQDRWARDREQQAHQAGGEDRGRS